MRRILLCSALLWAVAAAQVLPIRTAAEDLNRDGRPDRRGQQVTITGIVTAPDSLFDNRYTDIYVQDSTGGVNVFSFTMQNAELGDSVMVTGYVDWYRGKTEVASASLTRVASGRPLPEPRVLTCAQANTEDYEGELVLLTGITTSAVILSGNANYNITDATGLTQMRIDAQTAIPGLVCVSDTFSLVAVKSQYCSDTLQPLVGYQMQPRFRSDFSRSASDLPTMPIESAQAAGPDGVTPRRLGQMVRVAGYVSGPARIFTSGAKSLYIQDSSAGINVYGCSYDTARVGLLDSLGAHWDVIATITEYNGLTELANGVMVLADTHCWVPEAKLLPFNAGLTEAMESDVITLVGDVVSAPYHSGAGHNVTVKNGSAAVALRINDAAGIPVNWLTVGRRVRVTGVVGQYDNSAPYTTGYQLMPRFISDVIDTSGAFVPAPALVIDTIVPNPFCPGLGQAASVQVNSPTTGYRLNVDIYDLEGRLVKELLSNSPGGYFDLKWDGTDRLGVMKPAGTYLVNVKASRGDGSTEVITRPIVLAVKLN
jgi:DNA/RNA endonuclease YhcR with UshA esterase domain